MRFKWWRCSSARSASRSSRCRPGCSRRMRGHYVVQMCRSRLSPMRRRIGPRGDEAGKGSKIDPNSSDVKKYFDHLIGKHDKALERVGGGKKLYDYVYSFNGFAAQLTEEQAAKLERPKGVAAVTGREAAARHVLDPCLPRTRRRRAASGPSWAGTGRRGVNATGAGEPVIVGIIDSRIWPEASFSDRTPAGSSSTSRSRLARQVHTGRGSSTPRSATRS